MIEPDYLYNTSQIHRLVDIRCCWWFMNKLENARAENWCWLNICWLNFDFKCQWLMLTILKYTWMELNLAFNVNSLCWQIKKRDNLRVGRPEAVISSSGHYWTPNKSRYTQLFICNNCAYLNKRTFTYKN